MAAASHASGHGIAEANGAGRRLGFGRCDNLKHVRPVKVLVGIDGLGAIVARWRDYEAVIGMDESAHHVLALNLKRFNGSWQSQTWPYLQHDSRNQYSTSDDGGLLCGDPGSDVRE